MQEKITIVTWLGHEIDLVAGPRPDQIEIEDIAHSLSLQCRYAGHIKNFYSVAEHSVYVARHSAPLYAIYYLMHDAAEYLTQDVSYPMKCLVWGKDYKSNPEYKKIFDRFDKAILERFGLKYEAYKNLSHSIKEVDLHVGDIEKKVLKSNRNIKIEFAQDEPLYEAVWGMEPQEAESLFLSTFNSLMK